ncbi:MULTISPECIES: glycosyltransferase [Nocardia]|uniref:glycosyltransferase n=1 Tax=Nocardia TaxID=1817 RepID=UPI00135881A2|nr:MULTISPECIES: glycosyltransferase [Nocardia]
MIGYYIHHHGCGHLLRAQCIRAHIDQPVVALSSLSPASHQGFDDTVELPAGDRAAGADDPTAGGMLHWVPRRDPGLADRMAAVAAWIADTRPDALVVDVSVEVALLARLHGVPVVAMALPGTRTDPAHQMLHRIAERLIAAWPRGLYDPSWLHPYADKTHYVGGITRFAERVPARSVRGDERPVVLVLAGAGGAPFTAAMVRACAQRHRRYRWRTLGSGDWVDDPWPQLCEADVIVSHAGQSAVADIAAAGKPAILIPAERPFGEQHATGRALAAAGMALTLDRRPDLDGWPALVERARALDTDRWRWWHTRGAAARAAAAVNEIDARGLCSAS